MEEMDAFGMGQAGLSEVYCPFYDESYREDQGQERGDNFWGNDSLNLPQQVLSQVTTPIFDLNLDSPGYDVGLFLNPPGTHEMKDHEMSVHDSKDVLSTQEPLLAESSGKEKREIKGDDMRNLYPNMMNVVLRCILKQQGQGGIRKKLQRIISRVSSRPDGTPVDLDMFLEYCQTLRKRSYSLKDIYRSMNSELAGCSGREKSFKRVFGHFVVWFLRRRYSVYVMRSSHCKKGEQAYLRGKNVLTYLPQIRASNGEGYFL